MTNEPRKVRASAAAYEHLETANMAFDTYLDALRRVRESMAFAYPTKEESNLTDMIDKTLTNGVLTKLVLIVAQASVKPDEVNEQTKGEAN